MKYFFFNSNDKFKYLNINDALFINKLTAYVNKCIFVTINVSNKEPYWF